MSCMMMDAEIYGMTPSARTEKRSSAPPENMLNRSTIDPWVCLNISASATGSIPGTGICVPIRNTTSAPITNSRRCLRSVSLPPSRPFPPGTRASPAAISPQPCRPPDRWLTPPPPLQRHLATFESDLVIAAGARVLTLVALAAGLAQAGADAAADARTLGLAASGRREGIETHGHTPSHF